MRIQRRRSIIVQTRWTTGLVVLAFPWTGKMSGARFPRRRSFQEHETSDNAQYFIRASKCQNVTMKKKLRVVQRKNEKQRNIKKTGEERNQRHLHAHIYSLPFLYCNFYKYIYTHTKHMLLRNRNKSRNRSLRSGKGRFAKIYTRLRDYVYIFPRLHHPASTIFRSNEEHSDRHGVGHGERRVQHRKPELVVEITGSRVKPPRLCLFRLLFDLPVCGIHALVFVEVVEVAVIVVVFVA